MSKIFAEKAQKSGLVFPKALFYTAGYLKESDSDLNVFWYRPHHDSSVGVFDARLPTMGLQGKKRT